AEDRERFQQLLNNLELKQPPNRTARSEAQALVLANEIGYPLVVRPSYVLGGRAMEIVYSDADLSRYMTEAVKVSNDSPVLLDRFLDDAVELDVDAVCDGEQVVIGGIMEHIEQAGIHSGDSACSLPPYSISAEVQDQVREQVAKMAKALGVVGLMNTQFAIKGDEIYVLEVNPRASRTVPFVSKAIGKPLAKIAARCMVGQKLSAQDFTAEITPKHYSVKEAVFPFIKFLGVDPILGPEMKSTGEVMGLGTNFAQAYAKAQLAAGTVLPRSGKAFLSVRKADRVRVLDLANQLIAKGFSIVATRGTAASLTEAGIECQVVNKVTEGRPNIVDSIVNEEIDLIVNTSEGSVSIQDSSSIRREALMHKTCYTTTIAGAFAMVAAMDYLDDQPVTRLQDLQ
ncbi:MAG: ATP-grasp domain-containing protein, partial [Gammaproteobacteria bacterium]|nr:ATP-grasp domain-containing protein [Gammaproteobacteria bacterium]